MEANDWLRQGIAAAKNGDKSTARELLLQVVEADENNEQAWLWLSGVVETDEDRRICLENVLALNPANAAAGHGLARLAAASAQAEQPGMTPISAGSVVRREVAPVSPAAAVLYPERQVKEWQWTDDVPLQHLPGVGFQSTSGYDDIWEKETEICAFCAQELAYDDTRCPRCKRPLQVSDFRYAIPTAELYIYFVLLLGTGFFFFIQVLTDVILEEPAPELVVHGLIFAGLSFLAGGVYFRQFWAYVASIVGLLLVVAIISLTWVTGTTVTEIIRDLSGEEYVMALAASPYLVLGAPLLECLRPLQVLAVVLALFYGVFKAGPDFERMRMRRIAVVERRLKDATHFYSAGAAYAGQEMWASAVLHFQRAAAHEPNRPYYQRALGQAYARLGFYQRALDALESALRISTNPESRAELEQLIAEVKQAQQQQETQTS
ncbi:MAG: hypothetical protein L0332_02215 [Chloroflexi bacterium]|nr:hypothetical protein [Chloroflexota bacterium]MCI0577544.1 hypothetical protein [Chloroflexota bacterium]MCI0645617.1 hypothetical protein [Chloroflexota bacterium]MCI0725529.1 hypothetical protein [Chloroflexota bacterium]